MKITAEILKQWGGNPSPDIKEPVEFLDVLNSPKVPRFSPDFLHYIRSYYRLSPEEFEAYCNYFEIVNSENFWYSEDITNSKNTFNSYGITNSVCVRNSSQVQNAIDVYNSQFVNKANDIAHSINVDGASRIFESQQIHDSYDIARSNDIYWSRVILNSSFLKDCSYTYMSDNLTDCHFCGFTRNSRHCLFCVGLENKEYHIFNQPVSQMEYEVIKETLMALLEAEKSTMIRIDESKHTAEERFKLSRRFDSIINGLSPEFFGWVGTLPNYSDDTFVSLFFRDREETL